ncbi:MAG: hypothetical protein ACXAB2_16350 [Candidatus Hodarchaeales archaeon]|jgi:hypothetical protein
MCVAYKDFEEANNPYNLLFAKYYIKKTYIFSNNMPSHDQAGIGSEHPYSHEIQLRSIIIFAFTWSVGTFILQLGEDLKQSIWFGFREN